MRSNIDPSQVVKRLNTNDDLLDILIEMEDFLDSRDLYAFKNWIDGVIIDGPHVSRYWCELTLKYPYMKMPDPAGKARLEEHDVRVDYTESTELVPVQVQSPEDFRPGSRKPKLEHSKIWLVTISIPRRFIDDIIDQNMENYDDVGIDGAEDATDAKIEGLDNMTTTEDSDDQSGGNTDNDTEDSELTL